jgi:uroporphyrin-III C-methyltransferase/precorrin-2 dehydrogenase/sirohydrochlorin ferrochelatase
MAASAALHPVFLKLAGRRVLLVGGGRVALGKLRSLVDAGATVSVVSPEICQEIVASGVALARRVFTSSDLDGVWFVVAAAPRDVNRAVAAAAEARGIFVNAVDDVESASAYAGAVLRRGGVTIALSTDGEAPALAGLLREALESVLPDDLQDWMTCARDIRREWLANGVPIEARRALLLNALVTRYQERLP